MLFCSLLSIVLMAVRVGDNELAALLDTGNALVVALLFLGNVVEPNKVFFYIELFGCFLDTFDMCL